LGAGAASLPIEPEPVIVAGYGTIERQPPAISVA
jgi:hypothetical protein